MRWKFITHAGIDGYSRLIVYLKCSTNNRASTVYELFLRAIQQYHLPSRVRSDQGRENISVAQHMIEHRGAERHSIITGSSVHNQRIERLWRDDPLLYSTTASFTILNNMIFWIHCVSNISMPSTMYLYLG